MLWIRNQDETILAKIDYFSIYESNKGFFIKGTTPGSDITITLGEYSSKEKALKVLNMLENFIDPPKFEGFVNDISPVKKIFKMPKDNEV